MSREPLFPAVRCRGAAISLEQQPNGYWRCHVSIQVPQLPEVVEYAGDSFHDADECLAWARHMIGALVSNV